jgi:hypothetical protein
VALSKQLSDDAIRLINYLSFKADCAREQEENPITLDMEAVNVHYNTLDTLQREKVEQLSAVMPKKPIVKSVTRPKNLYKKDGTLSSHGERWFELLQEQKLPSATVGPVNVVTGYQEGNPNSHEQVKDFLHSLGWKPATFKFVKDKEAGEERKIEQVRRDAELCPSVTALIDDHPQLQVLEDLSVIQHRLGIFKSYIAGQANGKAKATVAGITNTMRFKHGKPFVNMPGVNKPWGSEIRGSMIAPEGYVFIGADLVSLEDTTRRHYIQPLDPAYVASMDQPGWDSHLQIAILAGKITQDDYDFYRDNKDKDDLSEGDKERISRISKVRKKAKVVTYSAMYGVGAAKLAREIQSTKEEAQQLLDGFWKLNWAIRAFSEKSEVKVTGSFMWVKNKVSGFWINLRTEKDVWSSINQSTGVYVFDTWLALCRKLGLVSVGQWHDEALFLVKEDEVDRSVSLLYEAIKRTNDKLKLNVEIAIDHKVGRSYAEVH